MLLRLLLVSEMRARRRRRESVGWLLKSRVLLCYGRWRLLLLIACSSGRAVIKKAALSGALIAIIAAGVRITMLPASALRCGVVSTTDLAEGECARIARAAQRSAGHVPVGAACVQP